LNTDRIKLGILITAKIESEQMSGKAMVKIEMVKGGMVRENENRNSLGKAKEAGESGEVIVQVTRRMPRPGLIILLYEFGNKANYHIWHSLLKDYLAMEFGASASFMDTLVVYRPTRPITPSAEQLQPENDIGGLRRAEAHKRMDNWLKACKTCEVNDAKQYAITMWHISQES
jgi:hypothetical protein